MKQKILLYMVVSLVFSYISAGYKGIGYGDSVDMRAGQTDAGSKQGNTEIQVPSEKKGLGWMLKQSALALGGWWTVGLGHELSHAIPLWLSGDKAYVKFKWGFPASVMHFHERFPKKFMPFMLALGPVGGIATMLGILKGFNIYQEYRKSNDIKVAFKTGIHKPCINPEQSAGLGITAFVTILFEPINYLKASNSYHDGHQITDHFNLQGIKARIARGSMASAALGISAYLLLKDIQL